MRMILCGLALWATCAPVNAGYLSGNQLHEWCQTPNAISVPYVIGIYDALEMDQMITDQGARMCVAEGVTRGQLNDIVCKFVGETPEDRHFPAAILVLNAVVKAFPCAANQ